LFEITPTVFLGFFTLELFCVTVDRVEVEIVVVELDYYGFVTTPADVQRSIFVVNVDTFLDEVELIYGKHVGTD
jgi:hypothetical protein